MSNGFSPISWGEGASLALVDLPSSDCVTMKTPYGVGFYYIDQPGTPTFPIGLVKTESEVLDQFRLT